MLLESEGVLRSIHTRITQPPVSLFYLPQPAQFADPQIGRLLLLYVERLFGDAVLPAEITDWGSRLCLPKGIDNLPLRKR